MARGHAIYVPYTYRIYQIDSQNSVRISLIYNIWSRIGVDQKCNGLSIIGLALPAIGLGYSIVESI